MSTYAIKTFHSDLERLKHFGGTNKETAIRFAFQKLLDEYAKAKDLMLIPEVSLKTKTGKTVTPDGTLKDVLRLDHGYWESKDEADDINEEIKKKFAKSYPSDNILFEDSSTAVLIQHGVEVMRTPMTDEETLDKLLTKFVGFERPEITDFRKAIDKFREDIPKVTETLQDIIAAQDKTNPAFTAAAKNFLELCRQSINPDISADDIKEMMVQHILSADIFNTIFDETQFHQENNIARELNKVIETFFTGTTRRNTLSTIQHYYQTINAAAAGIADHHEKQMFLKVVYENFYKAYNPKAADRLGIVYTPNEIVQFMIKSTDYLLHKHFGKTLADKNVEILDPATGTGTFICDIIDFLPKNKVEYKYKNELHANELAILPYYIANLNIEYTYKQKTGQYAEFESLCLVDTLDNTGFHWVGKQGDLFGVSAENANRIKKQNERKISVIIGNPPYNAKQENYNFQNANRAYKEIDKRIKDTFIKHGKAQNQIVVYDMYTRFYRWAMDRLDENGVVAFITNRSFIDGRAFDGFRKIVASEFNHIYIVDLGGDVRANPKLSGTKHNVFGIQTGVAIMFLVKRNNILSAQTKRDFKELKRDYPIAEEPVIEYRNRKYYSIEKTRIDYIRRPEFDTIEQKLTWLHESRMATIDFDIVSPDKNHNWINQADNNWDELLPLISKDAKSGKSDKAIFKLFSRGVETGRDEWVYDKNKENLLKKMIYLADVYNLSIDKKEMELIIKWSSSLKSEFEAGKKAKIEKDDIRKCLFRPFSKLFYFSYNKFSHRLTKNHFDFFGNKLLNKNLTLSFNGLGMDKPFSVVATNGLVDIQLMPNGQSASLYCYSSGNKRIDNITDWGVEQFREYYFHKDRIKQFLRDHQMAHTGKIDEHKVWDVFPYITKEDVFHYVYAVLHHPDYCKKYELNLKREFPRIPFYDNFWQWAKWGEQLMQLHIDYEKVEPYPLQLVTLSLSKGDVPKAKLKASKETGVIVLDENTELHGIPKQAWDYKLGNRSALEWILDQYKESKPKDPTIAEKFNTYKFADYKEQVIDLLKRVCTVSVETMKIINSMPG